MMSYKQDVSPKTNSKPCNCGCRECESVSCQLDCLVQPRFFHGQVLSDQDLTQLLHWTQSKLRLNRFRDGWGVVCGLEVRCECDSKQSGKVTISPGYALSGCGDDIVICEPQCVDLSVVFKSVKDPCAIPRRSTKEDESQPDPIQFPLFSGPSSDVYRVDLFAHYDELESDPKTTLGRGNCRELGQCENTRTREIATIIPRLTSADSSKATDTWEKKGIEYTKLVRGLQDAYERYLKQQDIVGFRKWLMDWLAKYPLHHFCFISDWLEGIDLSVPVGADRRTLEAQLAALRADYTAGYARYIELERLTGPLGDEISSISTKLNKTLDDLNNLNSQMKPLHDQLGQLSDQFNAGNEEERKAIRERMNAVEAQMQPMLDEMRTIDLEKQKTQAELDNLYLRFNPLAQEHNEMNNHLVAVDVQIKEFEKKLAELPTNGLFDQMRAVLGWIALDMLIDALQCECGGAADDQVDVPLARVWVQKSRDGRNGTRYQVLGVDDQPPFRRPLGLDCWPAPVGNYNLGRFVWRKKDDVAAELRLLAIDMPMGGLALSDAALFDQVSGLDFSRSFYARPGESVNAITIKSEVFGERIVGFGK